MNSEKRKILIEFRKALLKLVRAITSTLEAKNEQDEEGWDREMRGQILVDVKKFLGRVKIDG